MLFLFIPHLTTILISPLLLTSLTTSLFFRTTRWVESLQLRRKQGPEAKEEHQRGSITSLMDPSSMDMTLPKQDPMHNLKAKRNRLSGSSTTKSIALAAQVRAMMVKVARWQTVLVRLLRDLAMSNPMWMFMKMLNGNTMMSKM